MVLDPGAETELSMRFMMTADMSGPHDFRVQLETNDPAWGDSTLKVLSDWVVR